MMMLLTVSLSSFPPFRIMVCVCVCNVFGEGEENPSTPDGVRVMWGFFCAAADGFDRMENPEFRTRTYSVEETSMCRQYTGKLSAVGRSGKAVSNENRDGKKKKELSSCFAESRLADFSGCVILHPHHKTDRSSLKSTEKVAS